MARTRRADPASGSTVPRAVRNARGGRIPAHSDRAAVPLHQEEPALGEATGKETDEIEGENHQVSEAPTGRGEDCPRTSPDSNPQKTGKEKVMEETRGERRRKHRRNRAWFVSTCFSFFVLSLLPAGCGAPSVTIGMWGILLGAVVYYCIKN